MPVIRTPALLRKAATLLSAMLLVPLLSACPKGDVGASCNHGDVQPPDSKVVTFPALSCNDLLCVYADDAKAPTTDCAGDADCNTTGDGKTRFTCQGGNCKLSSTYVLERSMCSRTCATDDDCVDGGIGDKVLAKDSNCANGFKCVQIQKLGEFCCKKLCVCDDDLNKGNVEKLQGECELLPKDENNDPVCEDMNALPPAGTATAGDTAAETATPMP